MSDSAALYVTLTKGYWRYYEARSRALINVYKLLELKGSYHNSDLLLLLPGSHITRLLMRLCGSAES